MAYLAICLPDTAIHRRDSPIFHEDEKSPSVGIATIDKPRHRVNGLPSLLNLSLLAASPGGRCRDFADKLQQNRIRRHYIDPAQFHQLEKFLNVKTHLSRRLRKTEKLITRN